MIKVRLTKNEGRNTAPPIDNPEGEIHSQTKIDGFGKSTEYGLGAAGNKDRASDFQPRYAMEEIEECGCGDEEEYVDIDDSEGLKYFDLILTPEEEQQLNESLIYEKKDRCYYQAKRKYKVFPSAYASGYIVRCRKGKVGRKKKKSKKEESLNLEQVENLIEELLEEGTFDKEKNKGLHGWFARRGGKGKSKGWVDCNTCRTNPKTGRKSCKSCGRQSGEKRGKYPACRPTPSACTKTGTRKKKSSRRVSWKKKKEE